ncbi:hypothetical protein [Rhodococcoides yunnanense]|uniref:hypothetical protein n=1 Tax=Rhodococcoides yunnanense TaxID=278209 RepID=UPI0022B0D0BF|nr:hypothetical protein [Rhodococcus yunnanensis]MCZ4277775.1 hypothetical protein [Rhodococcus yunnanensis]
MAKTVDQADATTRAILGPQFTAMRNLVEAAENSRQKAEAVTRAQADHVDSTTEFIAAYDAARAAGFTTAQLKKGGYVRPSLKGVAKPATSKKDPAPTPPTEADGPAGEPGEGDIGQQNHDMPASEHHQDSQGNHSDHDAMAS